MAYDAMLADEVRELLAGERSVTERRMFGGLAFLVADHMAVCVTDGGLMVRVDPADGARWAEAAHVEPMVMRGRRLAGWLLVAPAALTGEDATGGWVRRGTAFARTLPPKPPKPPKPPRSPTPRRSPEPPRGAAVSAPARARAPRRRPTG